MEEMPPRPKRLNRAAIFEDLAYEPHPGQLVVHNSKALRRTLACGTRFGKSTCAAMEACVGLLEPRPATLGWVVAPTYDLTKRIWLRVVHMFQERLPHRIIEVIPREHRILVANLGAGISELRAKSADQPAGLLGEALDFVVVDEAASLRDDTWSSYIMPRLIDRRGWSLIVGTPKGPGWFFGEYKRGQKNRDPDCESWALPTWTNPHVSGETIEAEKKRLSEEQFDQQFGAKFIGVPEDPCEVCGGTDPEANFFINLLPGEELGECPACGEVVDEVGHTLNTGSGAVLMYGELRPDEVEEIEREIAQRAWRARNRELKKAGLPPEPPLPRKPDYWGKPAAPIS